MGVSLSSTVLVQETYTWFVIVLYHTVCKQVSAQKIGDSILGSPGELGGSGLGEAGGLRDWEVIYPAGGGGGHSSIERLNM